MDVSEQNRRFQEFYVMGQLHWGVLRQQSQPLTLLYCAGTLVKSSQRPRVSEVLELAYPTSREPAVHTSPQFHVQ